MTGEQQRSQARHQRILDAALEVFARRGYRQAGVDDIAVESGTSKGGIYFHFPTKAAILHALLRRTASLLLQRAELAMQRVDDPIARVDAALVTVLRLFAEHRTLARLFLVESIGAGPEFSAALMEVHEDVARLIARHLDDAVRSGAIAPIDTALTGTVWFGALNELIVRWVFTGQPERLEDAYPALRALLLRSIGAPVGGRSYGASRAAGAVMLPLTPEKLRAGLQAGHQRARNTGRPIVVSISVPLPALDPLDLFARADTLTRDRIYWEHASAAIAVCGVGTAHTIDAADARSATDAWNRLLSDAVIDGVAPVGLGGFAFDPAADAAGKDAAEAWNAFGTGSLVLPRISLMSRDGNTLLAVNDVVSPDTVVDTEAARLLRWCEALFPLDPRVDGFAGAAELTVSNLTPRDAWEGLVAEAARSCGAESVHNGEGLRKVVLARAVHVSSKAPFDPAVTLGRLRESYPTAYLFAIGRAGLCFVGATPERLVRMEGRRVEADCLAGSAPRGATPEEDAYLGNALLASAKDRHEHEFVVQGVRETLGPLCTDLVIPRGPQLLRLGNVQHLYTPVQGCAKDGVGVLDLVAALHPTPAVGGWPRDRALQYIRAHEGMDRGWYAGPVGWLDAAGNGEFAVALRSAVLHGREATLFAGCGIVAESDPADEYDETTIKLRPLLGALSANREY